MNKCTHILPTERQIWKGRQKGGQELPDYHQCYKHSHTVELSVVEKVMAVTKSVMEQCSNKPVTLLYLYVLITAKSKMLYKKFRYFSMTVVQGDIYISWLINTK